jgi:hypothetical protein
MREAGELVEPPVIDAKPLLANHRGSSPRFPFDPFVGVVLAVCVSKRPPVMALPETQREEIAATISLVVTIVA